jgi:hypothetical protein
VGDPRRLRPGEYETLYRALDQWVTVDFPFRAPHYSNVKIPHDDV